MNIQLARPLPVGYGRVSQWFGEHPDWYGRFGLAGHNGVDYAVALGTPVLAAHAGRVTLGEDPAGYGRYVRVENKQYSTLYAHLASVSATPGAAVAPGDVLGAAGSSGNSTGPHLHFGLRVKGLRNPAYAHYIDPVPFRDT